MNVYEIVTDRICALLARGVVPWRRPWSGVDPQNLTTKKAYRGVNALMLGSLGFASPYWVTYKQARGLGGSVKKGEKGHPIVFFSTGKDDRESGDKHNRYFMLRYYTVFHVATQCERIDLPEVEARPSRDYRLESCERIAAGYADGPRVEHDSDQACYVPLIDTVRMPSRDTFESAEGYYATLFHELGHSTGAKHRLDRGLDTTFGSHTYSHEELVAECTAAFLCGKAGIDGATLENSAAYLTSWARKLRSEPRWIVMASGKAAKAADLILGVKAQTESEAA